MSKFVLVVDVVEEDVIKAARERAPDINTAEAAVKEEMYWVTESGIRLLSIQQVKK